MPLRDHFHPPLSDLRHWESFHSRWATAIADHLDGEILPEGYFAEVQVHVGRVEGDIAAFEDSSALAGTSPGETATAVWAPPAPAMKLPAEDNTVTIPLTKIDDETRQELRRQMLDDSLRTQ